MQMRTKIGAALAISLTLGFPMASLAQTAAVDTANVAAECAKSAAACKLALEQAIVALRALGLTPAQLNSQLGVLAGAALSGAKDLPAAEKLSLAGALTVISEASTDPAQIASLNNLAADLSSGASPDLAAFASAISAS